MMGALIDQWGARNVGIALLVVASLLLISAAIIAWEALSRGLGILALDRAQAAALGNDRQAAVAHGRDAASWLPDEPAAGLIAIDLSDATAKDKLARLELRVPLKQRPQVAAIAALHQVHHGSTPGNTLSGGDQAVIAHVMKLTQGGPPPSLMLPDADPPQAPLLAYAAQVRLRAAWAGDDREAIRTTAGELRLLMPGHPDNAAIEAVLMALTPGVPDSEVTTRLSRLTRGPRRDLILLKLAGLAPERAAALKPLLPAAGAVK
jgi:hypothetical protein